MNPCNRSVCAFVLAILMTVGATRAFAQDKSWLDENVLPTKPAAQIKFGDRVDGKEAYFPFSGRWPFKVREDKDGWLRLHDGRREGWVDKADFVLASKSFAYFDGRIQANPKDGFALSMRGAYWLEKKEPDNAIADFDACLELNAKDAVAFNNRGLAWAAKNDYDKAIADYTEALSLNPKNTVTWANRGVCWRVKKEWDRAIADYTEAVQLEPKFANAWFGRGVAWSNKKEYDKAIEDFTEAIQADAKLGAAYNDRALAWVAKKQPEIAIKDYNEAVRLFPKSALVITNRAVAWKAAKQFDKAIRDNEEAIRLDPKYAPAHSNLGWILATCPEDKHRNGMRAVELTTKACELTSWKTPFFIDALAAAHAEAGQFDQAIRYANQALESAVFAKQSGDAARKRLKLYEEKKAFRE